MSAEHEQEKVLALSASYDSGEKKNLQDPREGSRKTDGTAENTKMSKTGNVTMTRRCSRHFFFFFCSFKLCT